MTDTQKLEIQRLRVEGLSYGDISEKMGLSINTVKTYCKRHGFGGVRKQGLEEGELACEWCGVPVKQTVGRKKKRFCCDKCRNQWWNAHLDQVQRKAYSERVCPVCKKQFLVYGSGKKKFCSKECRMLGRGKGANYE